MGVTRNFRDRLAPSRRARTGLGGGSRAGGPQGSWVSVKPGDMAQGPANLSRSVQGWVAGPSHKGLFIKERSGLGKPVRGDESPGWQQ